MSAALQIFYSGFDTPFFKLQPTVQKRIEAARPHVHPAQGTGG